MDKTRKRRVIQLFLWLRHLGINCPPPCTVKHFLIHLLYYLWGQFFDQSYVISPVINTNGAGDCLFAGICHETVRISVGMDESCIDYGLALSARCVESRESVPSESAICNSISADYKWKVGRETMQ